MDRQLVRSRPGKAESSVAAGREVSCEEISPMDRRVGMHASVERRRDSSVAFACTSNSERSCGGRGLVEFSCIT